MGSSNKDPMSPATAKKSKYNRRGSTPDQNNEYAHLQYALPEEPDV